MIKRYNGIEQDPEGVYVMFEDYATLLSEDSRKTEAIQQIMNAIADVDGTMTAWLIGQAALRPASNRHDLVQPQAASTESGQGEIVDDPDQTPQEQKRTWWCAHGYHIGRDCLKCNPVHAGRTPREWDVLLDEHEWTMCVRQDGEGERDWIRVREVLNPVDPGRALPDEGNTWKCSKCGEINAGAFCPCSYEVQDDDPADPEQGAKPKAARS